MIFCPLCNGSNEEFATVCEHCHGFLQNRVTQLDLFDTAWGILENPKKTFRTITFAEHKTYSFSLFAFFGIGLFFALVFFNAGDRFDSLLQLIIVSILFGSVLGCCLAPFVSLFHYRLIKTAHDKGTLKILLLFRHILLFLLFYQLYLFFLLKFQPSECIFLHLTRPLRQ